MIQDISKELNILGKIKEATWISSNKHVLSFSTRGCSSSHCVLIVTFLQTFEYCIRQTDSNIWPEYFNKDIVSVAQCNSFLFSRLNNAVSDDFFISINHFDYTLISKKITFSQPPVGERFVKYNPEQITKVTSLDNLPSAAKSLIIYTGRLVSTGRTSKIRRGRIWDVNICSQDLRPL